MSEKEENMAESIVRIPKNNTDYDFIAFTFNNKHSYEDMNIIRTSDGNRYNEDLAPTINDLTAEVPGGDGMYYFNTHHKQKVFNISFAFDHLEEAKLYELKRWLNGKDMGDLWFAEAPYKVYTAKVTGQPNLKMLCFNEDGKRIYKGEGTVQFTAYWPYAHTPDIIQRWDGNDWINVGSGLVASNYNKFINYD
jgi:predicted phage tail component-like protein